MAAVIASIVWDVKNKLWFRLSPQIELGVFFWFTKGVCEQQGEQSIAGFPLESGSGVVNRLNGGLKWPPTYV